jgi:hypothetical protein
MVALELCEAAEHLEHEPSLRRRRLVVLGSGAQRHAQALQPVGSIQYPELRAPQPIELVDEHGLELALFGVL